MQKMSKFPSIEQFRNVCANVNRSFSYIGKDEEGNAIYDQSLSKPVLKFTGTCKIHGTNAGIATNAVSGMWAQSRENIITPVKDNAGFAWYAESNKSIFQEMIDKIAIMYDVNMLENTIIIFGEWAGSSIQKGVGVCNLDKTFFPFGVKVHPFNEEVPAYWLQDYPMLVSEENRIYDIRMFKTWEIDIDFNHPELIQNTLQELTLQVEAQCPVAKHFGFDGIGEGIVWGHNEYRFKTKGEKHSSSKVKTVASVDVEKVNSIKEFVEYSVTDSRFNQALENIFPNDEPIDVKKLGNVIRWVVKDVMKEEIDVLVKNNIEPKEVNSGISAKVREQFFKLA